MTCGCERNLVVGPYQGPALDFDPGDFSAALLNAPQGSWNNTADNLAVLHTFRPVVPDTCAVEKAVLRVEVKREDTGMLSDNDGFRIVHAGGTTLYGEGIWAGNPLQDLLSHAGT